MVYEYRMRVVKVVDGDTLDAELDLGFYLRAVLRLRLLGVNAPELRAQGGREARQQLIDWLSAHANCGNPLLPFTVRTQKSDHFGRWLGEITCLKGHSLNQELAAWLQSSVPTSSS